MKFFFSFLVIGFLAMSCNDSSDNSTSTIDSLDVAPVSSGVDTTVTDPLTRTDSTQKKDTLK